MSELRAAYVAMFGNDPYRPREADEMPGQPYEPDPRSFRGEMLASMERASRRAWVRMTWEMLPALLKGHPLCAITSNLPTDALIEHVVVDDVQRMLRVHLVSEAFAPVPEGGIVPEFHVEVAQHWPVPGTAQWGDWALEHHGLDVLEGRR